MLKSCLIAAHDPWFIQLLKIYSEEVGLRVIQAFNGEEVLAKVGSEAPGVILLQMDLPGTVKGPQIISHLRTNPQTEHIPIIVFSWQGLSDETVAGAAAHLVEPVTYEGFTSALQSAGVRVGLERSRRHPENSSVVRRPARNERR